jgi:hypothetical protein
MNRLQQRLADLEKAIAPKDRNFVFVSYPEEDDSRSRADQRAAFDVENGVTASDTVQVRVSYS